MTNYNIYCDGACSGNPGPGGYGVIIDCGKSRKKYSDGERHTTNNRMELKAAIDGISRIKDPSNITVHTDSQYLVLGMTSWISGWIKKGWKNSQKEDVKNRDLWEELLSLSKKHNIKWQWLKGHSGHPENEECDKMAREMIKKIMED